MTLNLITKEMSITALPCNVAYMQFSWCVLFTKATPTKIWICHDFNYHINERIKPKTCLTNHKGSISHPIMPLVINSLRGGHTHIHILMSRTKETSRAPAFGHACGLVHAWFKIKSYFYCGRADMCMPIHNLIVGLGLCQPKHSYCICCRMCIRNTNNMTKPPMKQVARQIYLFRWHL